MKDPETRPLLDEIHRLVEELLELGGQRAFSGSEMPDECEHIRAEVIARTREIEGWLCQQLK